MFSKKFLLCISMLMMLCFFSCNDKADSKTYSTDLFVMDTLCTISSDSNCIRQLSDELNKMNTSFDACSESGEIYRLNNKRRMKCSDYLTELIEGTISLSKSYGNEVIISSGAVTLLWKDVQNIGTLPNDNEITQALSSIGDNLVSVNDNYITLSDNCKIDAGAVAKGYALDVCKKLLEKNSSTHSVISMTSSVLLYDTNQETFDVQIRNPNGDGIIGSVKSPPCFLSTSGGYERFFTIDGIDYNHIIDLSDGYPSQSDLTSVTVFCDSGILSDYLSTKIFIGGIDSINSYLNSEDYKVVAFDINGNAYISEGLDFTENTDE